MTELEKTNLAIAYIRRGPHLTGPLAVETLGLAITVIRDALKKDAEIDKPIKSIGFGQEPLEENDE